ncbi:MAG: hypothetical protein KME22_30720 [Hassallia sp. WJT32-NPBG1]|jgi:hypothetical protein|nr:hypothetical protein [Hassallia sp. WJT32-NPBG1]
METQPGKLELDKEYPSVDEASAIQTIEHNYQADAMLTRNIMVVLPTLILYEAIIEDKQ